jgi:hypothetical protein
MTATELSALIDHALSTWKEPDPHVIARRLYAKLTEDQKQAMIVDGLAQRISLAIRSERAETGLTPVDRPSMASDGTETVRRVGRSKWQRNMRYAQRVFVEGEWKFLAQCTVSEVDWLADQRAGEAAKLNAIADGFRKLADHMRATGAQVVSELPEDIDLAV